MSDPPRKSDSGEWPELARFQRQFREFVAERDWDQFHMPKKDRIGKNEPGPS
jgi:dCTP diphosphatase